MLIIPCKLKAFTKKIRGQIGQNPWSDFLENRIALSDLRVSLSVSLADSLTVTLSQRRCSTGSLFRQPKGAEGNWAYLNLIHLSASGSSADLSPVSLTAT